MEKLKNFIQNFIALEQELLTLELEVLFDITEGVDIEVFNEKLAELEAFAIPEMQNSFGIEPKKDIPKDDSKALMPMPFEEEMYQKVPKSVQDDINRRSAIASFRYVFEIAQYPYEFYKVLLSIADPKKKKYGECFLIKKMNGAYKIVAKYVCDKEDEKLLNWKFSAGDQTIVFNRPNAPEQIKTIANPKKDKIFIKKEHKPYLKHRKGGA